ncbi:hypothetical protein ABK040_008317 [Willaertia magna]
MSSKHLLKLLPTFNKSSSSSLLFLIGTKRITNNFINNYKKNKYYHSNLNNFNNNPQKTIEEIQTPEILKQIKEEQPKFTEIPFLETIPNRKIRSIAQKAENLWTNSGGKTVIPFLEENLKNLSEEEANNKLLEASLNDKESNADNNNNINYSISILKLKEQLATIYFTLNQLDKAISLFEELREGYYALAKQWNIQTSITREESEIEERSMDRHTFAMISSNLADCYKALGKENEFQNVLEETIELCNKTNGKFLASVAIERLAYHFIEEVQMRSRMNNANNTNLLDLTQKLTILKGGIDLLNKGLVVDEDNDELLYARGITYEELTKVLPISRTKEKDEYTELALKDFEKVLIINPKKYEAELNLGDCYARLQKEREALSRYSSFLDHFGDFFNNCVKKGKNIDCTELYIETIVKVGLQSMKTNDFPMAIQYYTFAIEFINQNLNKFPKKIEILKKYKVISLNKRGWCHYRRTEWWKCIDDNTEAIQLDNTFFPAFRDRAEAYECLGKDDLAKEDKVMCEYLKRKYAVENIF